MIRYRTEVVDAHHTGLHWRLTTQDGETLDADFVILATASCIGPARRTSRA